MGKGALADTDRRQFITITATNTWLLDGLRDSANKDVWREFCGRYYPVLRRYARKSFGIEGDQADDVIQDILSGFCHSYIRGDYEREKGRLRKWLLGIATRQFRNALRRNGRNREHVLADDQSGCRFIESVPDDDKLEEEWDRQWRIAVYEQCLQEARARFEVKTMEAFELTTMGEVPVPEIAARLGMTTNAVYLAKYKVTKCMREMVPVVEEIF